MELKYLLQNLYSLKKTFYIWRVKLEKYKTLAIHRVTYLVTRADDGLYVHKQLTKRIQGFVLKKILFLSC